MKKVYMVMVLDKYESGWIPDYARVFANKSDAEAHAEELRNMDNPMEHEIVINEVGYVD